MNKSIGEKYESLVKETLKRKGYTVKDYPGAWGKPDLVVPGKYGIEVKACRAFINKGDSKTAGRIKFEKSSIDSQLKYCRKFGLDWKIITVIYQKGLEPIQFPFPEEKVVNDTRKFPCYSVYQIIRTISEKVDLIKK